MTTRKGDQKNYPNPYASGGGSTAGMHNDTAGQRYRVRNDDESGKVWGSNLPYEKAHKLKEQVCGARKSKNAIIENMDVPFPPVAPAPVVVHTQPAPRPAPIPQAPNGVPPELVVPDADSELELANEALDGDFDA